MAQPNVARRSPAPEQQEPESAGNRPVERFHEGSVHVSIWENEGVNGAFRTASFQLRYRDGNNEWRTGTSYGVSDLSNLEKAAKEARERIGAWQQQRASPPPPGA